MRIRRLHDITKVDYVARRPYPHRTPLTVATAAKDIIKDKIVCDIGCGEGDILACMSKYAKECIGIEIDKERYDNAVPNIKIIHADFDKIDLPVADVYYTWIGEKIESYLIEKIFKTVKHACKILVSCREGNHVAKHINKWGGYIIEYPCLESSSMLKRFSNSGNWWLGVIDKPAESDKTVVLTFDDRLISHYNVAYTLLKSLDMTATFFVCNKENMWRKVPEMHERSMSWEQVKELSDNNFDIGNHTLNHHTLTEIQPKSVVYEVTALSKILDDNKIDSSGSFCYPGYFANAAVKDVLLTLDYRFARIGYFPYDDKHTQFNPSSRTVQYYQPGVTDRLMLPCTGIVNDIYGIDDFKKDVENIPPQQYGIFTFHGLVKPSRRKTFIKIVEYLDRNKIKTASLADIPI